MLATRPLALLTAVILLVSVSCDRAPASNPAQASSARPVSTATVEKFQCNRCHTISGVDAPNMFLDCTGCHQAIMTGTGRPFPPDDVAVWRSRLKHLIATPTLFGVERLRRDWFVEFVQHPHSLRPGLSEQMPRMPITPADAQKLADELGLSAEPLTAVSEISGDGDRGQRRYVELGCTTCHWYSGSGAPNGPTFDRPTPVEQRRAPDLRHTRDRLTRATVDAWLAEPSAVKSDAMMQMFVPDETDRQDLIAFLFEAPLAPLPERTPPPLPDPLDREVTWEEVNAKIFHATCQHCHTTGGPALPGEGGAGNTGGFGYAGRGVILSEHAVIARSLLTPGEDGVAPLVHNLMARHAEVAGRPVAGVLGMPLGLPPVDLDAIAALRAWIRQGAPGPASDVRE